LSFNPVRAKYGNDSYGRQKIKVKGQSVQMRHRRTDGRYIMEIGEAIKNPAYRIFQTEYSGCLDISTHA